MRHNGIIVFKILLSYFNLWFVKGKTEDYFYCPSINKMHGLVHSKNNMWTSSIILKLKKLSDIISLQIELRGYLPDFLTQK